MITKASKLMDKVNILHKNAENEYETSSISLEALYKEIL